MRRKFSLPAIGFLSGLLVMIATAILSTITLWKHDHTSAEIAHVQDVTQAVVSLLSHAQAADATVHGYFIAGNEQDLQAHDQADQQMAESLTRLRRLTTAGQPQHREWVRSLDLLAAREHAELSQAVQARREPSHGATAQTMLAQKYARTAEQFHRVGDSLYRDEVRILGEQTQTYEQQARQLAVATLCGVALAIALVGLALWLAWRSQRQLARENDERRRAEEQLWQSQRFVHRVLETTPNLIYVYDQIERRAVYVNRQVSAILGYTPEQIQMMGQDLFKDILTENDQRRVLQAIAEYGAVKDGQVVEWEAPFRRACGEWRWLRGKEMVFTRTPDGRPKQTLGTAEDITERKRAEEALRQSEEQYRTLFDLSPDGVALVDSTGAIAAFNEHLRQKLGYTPQEFARLNVADVEATESREQVQARIDRMLRAGEDRFETRHRTKRGQLRDVAIIARRVDFCGKPYFLAVWRDITEEKQMREQLQRAKQAAETANQAKDQFLAVLSHELRTPLTPVLAAVSLLERDPKVDDMIKEDLDVIRRNVELEARLIDDLLDLTRIVRGKLVLRREAADVHTLLERAMSICCAGNAVDKQLHVLRSLDAVGHETWGDPVRLEQVFWNLLNNAVKFTPGAGLIEIRTSNPDPDRIRVEVRDTGVGIDPQAIGRIFDAFEQGNRSVTRQFGGLGLGLAITRRLVEMHGGTIAARSEGRGKGATFMVELPIHNGAQ